MLLRSAVRCALSGLEFGTRFRYGWPRLRCLFLELAAAPCLMSRVTCILHVLCFMFCFSCLLSRVSLSYVPCLVSRLFCVVSCVSYRLSCVLCLFRVWSLVCHVFKVSCRPSDILSLVFSSWTSCLASRVSCLASYISCREFYVSGYGCRVWVLKSRASSFRNLVSRVSGLLCRISCLITNPTISQLVTCSFSARVAPFSASWRLLARGVRDISTSLWGAPGGSWSWGAGD